MNARNDFLHAQRATSRSSSRIASSSKLEHSGNDTAAISQSAKLKSEGILNNAYLQNLQSTRLFLKFKKKGI